MKERKDKDIERILRPCIEGGAKPAARVTAAAKAELHAQAAARAVPVPAAAAQGACTAGTPQRRSERRTVILLTAAACLLVLAVGMLLWFLEDGARPGALLFADGKTYVAENGLRQSSHADEGAVSPACLPWVKDEEIVCCREFTLQTRASDQDRAAETAVYRVEYRADDVSATVYVERENICLVTLSDYKHLPESRTCGGTQFRVQAEDSYARVYFEADGYKYNLRLETGEEEQLDAALTAIGESL